MLRPLPKYSLMLIILVAATSHAATFFVRPGASGNGTSWANAWGDMGSISWVSVTAGSTVCVAGGTYAQDLAPASSGSSGNPVTVKRAIASDPTCGSPTAGWNAAFDAQVVMNGQITLQRDFVTIDGMVQNGIKIIMQNPTGSNYSGIGVGAPTNGVVLSHIEVSGPCPNGTPCPQNGDHRSINLNNWNGSSYDLQNNMTIQYMNLHGACNLMWSAHSTNAIIQFNRFADSMDTTPGNPYCHPNVIAEQDSTNITFRYNEITNWDDEGIMACPSSACSSSWDIYGNIFHQDSSGGVNRGLEVQSGQSGPYHVYNNTFYNVTLYVTGTANGGSYTSDSKSRNNLFWNSGGNALPDRDYDLSNGALSEAHGQANAANPFVNSTGANYHLTGHTNAGLNLGSPFNIDYDGNGRTTWDRGAYEFGSSTGGGPQPPTGLSALVH